MSVGLVGRRATLEGVAYRPGKAASGTGLQPRAPGGGGGVVGKIEFTAWVSVSLGELLEIRGGAEQPRGVFPLRGNAGGARSRPGPLPRRQRSRPGPRPPAPVEPRGGLWAGAGGRPRGRPPGTVSPT